MKARLQDVAELAGVSTKTVSNVVNDYPFIRDATREKVLQAMEQLNYRANLSARNLARGRTGLIALAIPRLSNPYFAELAGYVIEAAEKRSWTVLIDETRGDPQRERRVIEGLGPYLLDGVVISVQGLTRPELEKIRPGGALVLLGEKIFEGPADHVAADNVAAAQAVTQHLIDIGRRDIAVMGMSGTPLRGTPDLRLEGYRRALDSAGLPYREQYVRPVHNYQRRDGAQAMVELLELPQRPDAVVCFNDEMAVGALNALSTRRIAVPGDIALAGFDDIDEGRYCVPQLTTVSWDNPRVAQTALDLLTDRIEQREALAPREVQTNFTVMIRASTLADAR